MELKPINFLFKKLNNEVTVRLKNNMEYRGIMVDCDYSMNIILENAGKYNDGKLVANLGDVIIRGSNILYVKI